MKKILFGCLIVLSSSCTQNEVQNSLTAAPYFDLENYFKAEASRLTKTNPQLDKTVIVNGESESRDVTISDWKQEFESFIDADINKAAWRGAFKVQKDSATTTYSTLDEKIPVKKLVISFEGNKVSGIVAIVNNTNKLYTSTDHLTYYPDSLYQIKKIQQVRFMESKNYDVTVRFK